MASSRHPKSCLNHPSPITLLSNIITGRQPGVQIRLGKINTEARNTSIPLTYQSRGDTPSSEHGELVDRKTKR